MPYFPGLNGNPGPRRGGFSLVELIVVIVIAGVLAGAIGTFISGPIQGFFDHARRGKLVDAAQLALLRMGRDLRSALPNSVRVSGGVLELLLTVDGDRYRTEPPGDATGLDWLDFTAADQSFATFAALSLPDPSAAYSVAIYPLNSAEAYSVGSGVMTPAGVLGLASVTVGGATEYRVTLPAPHLFPRESPTHRVFVVQGPVSWLCNGGSLVRYDGYVPQAAQPANDSALAALPSAVRTVVIKDVQACNFQYNAGAAQRNAVASISVVLADAATPTERVRLMRQVHVSNAP